MAKSRSEKKEVFHESVEAFLDVLAEPLVNKVMKEMNMAHNDAEKGAGKHRLLNSLLGRA